MELKSFFRYVGRNKTYTLINVIGFALSLAFVILTMAYTWQESTVDHFRLRAYGWLFLPVAAFCLLVSFAAVGIQGRIASRTNPAENIKTE